MLILLLIVLVIILLVGFPTYPYWGRGQPYGGPGLIVLILVVLVLLILLRYLW